MQQREVLVVLIFADENIANERRNSSVKTYLIGNRPYKKNSSGSVLKYIKTSYMDVLAHAYSFVLTVW